MSQNLFLKAKNYILRIKLHPYFQSRPNLFLFFSSLLLNISLWILLYLRIKPSQYPIPLHFNVYFGIDVIDKWQNIFVMPALGLLFTFINFIIGGMTFKHERIISYLLNSISLFLQILLILGAMSSILIQV